ncbi:MAG: lipid A deacylase LpxR family protein [Thiogranum sp.]|nr:lipid A deacylase LpxR family protein [Thiogranum sp.]
MTRIIPTTTILAAFASSAAGFFYAQPISADGDTQRAGKERASYRFEFINDFFFGTDQEVSGAWSLQKHMAVADSWETMRDVPDIVRRVGARFPTLTDDGRNYRTSFALGQITQTPVDLQRRDLIEKDVPYAGALVLSVSWYGYNDREFSGFELVGGVVGPLSLAGQAQKSAHALLGINKPKGWDNQLENEPVMNFNYMRKRKLSRIGNPAGLSFDTAINGNLCLGNLTTRASTSVEMRFGRNMPRGFVYIPESAGFGMNYKGMLESPDPKRSSLYGSLVLRGTGVAHDIFLDGNTFRDSHSVDKKTFVGLAIAGLHYERENWSASFNLMFPTDTVDTSRATEVEGRGELGSITIEWYL